MKNEPARTSFTVFCSEKVVLVQCSLSVRPVVQTQLNQQAIAMQATADSRTFFALDMRHEYNYCSGPRVRQLSAEEYSAYFRQANAQSYARRRRANRGCEDLNVEPHYLGRMNVVCANVRCKALHWQAESKGKSTFNDCCRHGKVFFEEPPEYPASLKALLLCQHPKWKKFFAKIRNFNSSVAFVGIAMKHVSLGPGIPHMRIQGKVMTTFNHALHPDSEDERSYGQLFIVDTDEAVKRRIEDPRNEGMDEEIAKLIDTELRRVNPYVDAFQMADELMRDTRRGIEEQRRNAGNFEPVPEPQVQILFHPRDGSDPRNYDLPKANEVAAIFTTDADGLVPEAYITVHERGKDIRRLRYIDPMLEPAAFPLLYPAGCKGYTLNIPLLAPDGKRKDASRREYVCWRMAVREGKFNPLHYSGRLFQEWAVSMFAFMEGDRMNFFKLHQKELKADSYNLRHFLEGLEIEGDPTVGNAIILPATYPGSPRYWTNQFEGRKQNITVTGAPI